MSKHTPGPWVADIAETYSVRAPDGGRICTTTNLRGQYGLGGRRDSSEVAANARLIAQAPRLLEALKAVLPYIESVCDCGPDGEGWKSDELMSLIAECNDAIAAATEDNQ